MLNLINGSFKWIGDPVECYHNVVENGMSTFYKAFCYNAINYQINDIILFKAALGTKLGQLLCVYESSASWHEHAKYRGVVKWFTKAADLPKIYTADINYDPDNEVVEDLRRSDTSVSLEDAGQKCTIIFAHVDDPVYLVDDMKLEPTFYFSCRYRIKRNKLIPLLTDIASNELIELNSIESTPRTYKIKSKTNDENKQKSSVKKCAKASPFKSVGIVMTPNRVKRNLNESFDNTPKVQGEAQILSYSIVENVVDSDRPIKIKLKLSDVQKLEPCILSDSQKLEPCMMSDKNEKKIESDGELDEDEGKDLFGKEAMVIIDRLYDKCVERLLNKNCTDDDKYVKNLLRKEGGQESESLKSREKTKNEEEKEFLKSSDKLNSEEENELLKISKKSKIGVNKESKSSKKLKNGEEKEPLKSSKILKNKVMVEKVLTNEGVMLENEVLSNEGSMLESEVMSNENGKESLNNDRKTTNYDKLNEDKEKLLYEDGDDDKLLNKKLIYDDHHYDEKILNNDESVESLDDVPLTERLRLRRRNNNNDEEITVRRSMRPKSRKSYADFVSPVKTTPRKTRLRSCDSDCASIETPSKKKNIKIADSETPLKKTSKFSNGEPILRTPSKRTRSTSVTFDDETNSTPNKKPNDSGRRPKRNAGLPGKYKDDFSDVIIAEDSSDFKSKNGRTGKNKNLSELVEDEIELVKRVSPLKIQRTPGKRSRYHVTEDFSTDWAPSTRARTRKLSEDDSNLKTPSKKQLTLVEDYNLKTPSKKRSEVDFINLEKDCEDYLNGKLTKDTVGNLTSHNPRTRTRKLSEDSEASAPPPRKTNLKSRSRKLSEDSEASVPSPRKTKLKSRSRKLSEDSEVSLPSPKKQVNIYKTPKKNVREVVVKTPKNTPSAKMRLIREGVITPSMQCRKTAVVSQGTPLNRARERLHVSYVPDALPCREKEFADIFSFVQGKLLDGCGGCMYVSGVPGTGKTATVTEVIRNLQETVKSGDIPDFTFVSINGMRLTEPRQSYVEILKQLTGKTVAWEQAQSMLDARFTKTSKKGQSQAIVMLVDELDILCTKRQDVVYNLLDWPTKATAQLIVITIANTMDLPERLLMGRVTSRLGLTRLTFQAYTHKQLQEIVMRRLMGTNAFNPDAIQLVARKVASVSGDARRALDICRRAAEIAESQGPHTLVSMGHVNEALNAMITQPKVRAIKRCSRLEQLILQAVVAEVERTGVDETTFADVYTMLSSVAGIDGFPMVSVTLALAAVAKLGSSRLLLTDQKSNDIHQRLILNVSPDDIYYALRKD